MTFYVLQIITLLGGLSLFLFGMDVMGKSLERLAGGKLQTLLAKMSSTTFRGFCLGMVVTAIIQSSSATTVMVVGFVNSGIMTLRQAIGVIIGSNVGTTATAWILSLSQLSGDSFLIQFFKPSTLAPMLGAIGIVLYMFFKDDKKKSIGMIMMGFMALMTGMDLMSGSMSFLKEEAWFADLMVSFQNPILGILVGAALTAIIQSSSASVGLLQSLALTGVVSYGTAIPIILGQNIGTTVTALLSSVGTGRNARRTALVHLYFNVVGVLLFCLGFYGIGLIRPWGFTNLIAEPMDIATVHTCFNLGATCVLLPMSRLLEKLAYKTIPREEEHQAPVLLDELLLSTPAVAIQRAHEIAAKMAATAYTALTKASGLTRSFDQKVFDEVIALEDETDTFEDALGTYLMKLTGRPLSETDNRLLNTVLYTISDIERIADHAVALAKAGREIHTKNIDFSAPAKNELQVLEKAVLAVVDTTVSAFMNQELDSAMEVEPQEQVVDNLVKEIKTRHIQRLRDGMCTVEYGFVLEDILTALRRSADHCSNIALELLQSESDKREAHEYLSALREGSAKESSRFVQQVQKYRAQYAFDDSLKA